MASQSSERTRASPGYIKRTVMAYPLSSFIRRNAKVTLVFLVTEAMFLIYYSSSPNRPMDWYDEKKLRLMFVILPILFVCALVYDYLKMKRLHAERQNEAEK
jgi:hypothetical protein